MAQRERVKTDNGVQFGIARKIWLIIGIPLAGFLVAVIVLTVSSLLLSHDLGRMESCDYPLSQRGTECVNGFRKQLNFYENAVLLGEAGDARSGDAQGAAIQKTLGEMSELAGKYGHQAGGELAKLRDDYDQYRKSASPLYAGLAAGGKPGPEFAEAGQRQRDLLTRFEAESRALNESVTRLVKAQRARSRRNILYMFTLFGLVAFLSVLAVRIVARRLLIRPAQRVMERILDLARGDADLTQQLEVLSRDEIGQITVGFNAFAEKMKGLIRTIKDNSDRLRGESMGLSRATDDLSSRTNEQAASITETSTTLENFTNLVRQNGQNAAEVNSDLGVFHREVVDKRALIENVTATMQEIDESSTKIDSIVNVINDISFQTNLLALNAAVEAARAGDAGRGFAVVAAEVRNLAQKTAESSKTIRDIVTRNVDSSRRGTQLVKETGEFFNSLMTHMQRIVEKIEFISARSSEQTTGIDQINLAVAQLENVINQNAALAESLSKTGRNIESNAGELDGLVGRFKVD